MRLAVLSLIGKHLPQGELFFAVIQGLELAILALDPGLIIGCVLLQFRHVGAFVVLGAGDETCINPFVNHVVGADVVVTVRRGTCIDEPAAFCRHVYVAVFGNDGTDSHIPFFFLQVDMVFRLGVDAGGILTLGTADIFAGIDDDCLFGRKGDSTVVIRGFLKDTDGPVGAGQCNLLALHRDGIGSLIGSSSCTRIRICCCYFLHILGDVTLGFQGNLAHVPGRDFSAVILNAAEQLFDHYIAGQGLAVCLAAHNLYVDIAAVV